MSEPETPSPDVMEVWREALDASLAAKNAVDWDYATDSAIAAIALRANQANQAAANVIAEAKARWEREKDAEIARLRNILSAIETADAPDWALRVMASGARS